MNSVYAEQNETISHIAWRVFGRTEGYVEQILTANPQLCELPALLPMGTRVILPILDEEPINEIPSINLWD